MTLSLGIEYNAEYWKTCFMEDGRTLELHTFADVPSVLSYVEQLCLLYPEPVISISSPAGTRLTTAVALTQEQKIGKDGQAYEELQAFLEGIQPINFTNYTTPAVPYLPSIPRHRKLNRGEMGTAVTLCSVATLLYRMRQQEANWTEMRFLYLEVAANSRSIVVVKDGQVVDGLSKSMPLELLDHSNGEQAEDVQVIEDAFWEGLTQDLAGLMAIHHFVDIVVMDRRTPSESMLGSRKGDVIERLNDTYQFYHFPHGESEPQGFEPAIGAAIIAEGLYGPGLAAEIVNRLQIKK
jgi:predicted butyrate kinase (DUF1464 family)